MSESAGDSGERGGDDREVGVRFCQLQPFSEEPRPRCCRTTGTAAPAARYLYICEDGLVHWCSQQRGHPGIPVEQYGPSRLTTRVSSREELRASLHRWLRASRCASRRVAPRSASGAGAVVPARLEAGNVSFPFPVRILIWAFVTNPQARSISQHGGASLPCGSSSDMIQLVVA